MSYELITYLTPNEVNLAIDPAASTSIFYRLAQLWNGASSVQANCGFGPAFADSKWKFWWWDASNTAGTEAEDKTSEAQDTTTDTGLFADNVAGDGHAVSASEKFSGIIYPLATILSGTDTPNWEYTTATGWSSLTMLITEPDWLSTEHYALFRKPADWAPADAAVSAHGGITAGEYAVRNTDATAAFTTQPELDRMRVGDPLRYMAQQLGSKTGETISDIARPGVEPCIIGDEADGLMVAFQTAHADNTVTLSMRLG